MPLPPQTMVVEAFFKIDHKLYLEENDVEGKLLTEEPINLTLSPDQHNSIIEDNLKNKIKKRKHFLEHAWNPPSSQHKVDT